MNIASLQRRLAPLLSPLAAAYAAAMRARAARYAPVRPSGSYHAACPVVSVGNISWGGTGKTPLVDYLLDHTAAEGIRTAVLTRGYKAAPPSLPFAVRPDHDPALTGDEPLLLARRHPEALVLVDPKRARSAAWAEANAAPDLFVLDDGMQHLAMARDTDIVLLTPHDLLDGWNRVIPSGSWREGATALARAHAFCIKTDQATFTALAPIMEKRLSSLNRPLFTFTLHPTGLSPIGSDSSEAYGATALSGGSPYTLICGTGNADEVRETASRFLGRPPRVFLPFPDHHRYTRADAAAARAPGNPVICTAKDAVKLASLLPHFGDIPVLTLDVRAVFGPALFTTLSFDAWWTQNLQNLRVAHLDIS